MCNKNDSTQEPDIELRGSSEEGGSPNIEARASSGHQLSDGSEKIAETSATPEPRTPVPIDPAVAEAIRVARFRELSCIDPLTGKRRCRAHNRLGDRCKLAPMKDMTVCATHGGKSPQAIRATHERLMALAPIAVECLVNKILDPLEESSVQVRASMTILSRCGLGEGVKLDITSLTELAEKRQSRVQDMDPEKLADYAEKLKKLALGLALQDKKATEKIHKNIYGDDSGAVAIEEQELEND